MMFTKPKYEEYEFMVETTLFRREVSEEEADNVSLYIEYILSR